MAVFNELVTLGASPGTASVHQVNGSLNFIGTVIPSFSSTDFRYLGTKLANLYFVSGAYAAPGDFFVLANSYFDGTNLRRGRANETISRLRLNGATTAAASIYQLYADTSVASAADSTVTPATIHSVSSTGAHTFGASSGVTLTHTFQSGNRTILTITGNNGITGPALTLNSTDGTSRNASILFSRGGTSSYTVGVDAAGDGTNALRLAGTAVCGVFADNGTCTFGPATAGLFHEFKEGVKCKAGSFGTTAYLPISIDANAWTIAGAGTTRTIDTNIDYATNGAWHFALWFATDTSGAIQIVSDVGYNSNLPGFYSANLNISGFSAVTYSNNGGKIRINTTTAGSNATFLIQGMAIGRYATMTGT